MVQVYVQEQNNFKLYVTEIIHCKIELSSFVTQDKLHFLQNLKDEKIEIYSQINVLYLRPGILKHIFLYFNNARFSTSCDKWNQLKKYWVIYTLFLSGVCIGIVSAIHLYKLLPFDWTEICKHRHTCFYISKHQQ